MNERVVITGGGVVAATGLGSDRLWEHLAFAESCLRPAPHDTSHARSRMTGHIPDFDPRQHIRRRSIRTLDRVTLHTLTASALALEDAGIDHESVVPETTGVVIGHSFGAITSTAAFHEELVRDGPKTLNPNVFPNTVHNSPPSQIGIEWGLRGINSTIVTGLSTSGLDALAAARTAIRFGHARVLISGGFDEVSPKLHLALDRLNLLSRDGRGGTTATEAVRPFDVHRNGTVLGEAAALMVLEAESDARHRGANIRAEIVGHGTYSGSGTRHRPAMVAAIERALADADIEPADVDLIVAEGCGWALADRREAEAVRHLFGGSSPPVTATKGITGYTMGASGALNVLTAVLCMERGMIPPVAGLVDLDPRCECGQTRSLTRQEIRVSLVLAGASSTRSVMVVRRPESG